MTDLAVSSPAAPHRRAPQLLLLLLPWLIFAVIVGYQAIGESLPLLLVGPDDHMRMVAVAEWLDGGGWYDHDIDRIDPPQGGELHWSRLVDLPLAFVIAALDPMVGRLAALKAAAIAVPLITLLTFLAAAVWTTRALVPNAPAIAGPLVALTLNSVLSFMPGRVDHHGWIMVCVLVAMGSALRIATGQATRAAAITGGLAFTTGLVIAGEILPSLFAVCLGLFLVWIRIGVAIVPRLRDFAVALAGGAVAGLAVDNPPAEWGAVACDAHSIAFVGVAVAVAAFWLAAPALAARIPCRRGWMRWDDGAGTRTLAGAIAGLPIAGLLILAFPECRGGPLAQVPTDQWTSWMDNAAGLQSLIDRPRHMMVMILLPILMALVTAVVISIRSGLSGPWLLAMVALAILGPLAVLHGRASLSAQTVAIPVLAWLLVTGFRYCDSRFRPPIRIFALGGVTVGVLGLAPLMAGALTGSTQASARENNRCGTEKLAVAITTLPSAPPALIAAEVFQGPMILTLSPHSVLAAPYHRMIDGNRRLAAIYAAPTPDDARQAVERAGVTHLVICRLGEPLGGAFIESLANGATPAWLSELTRDGSGYRVLEVGTMPGR